jgi:hypothetical protein
MSGLARAQRITDGQLFTDRSCGYGSSPAQPAASLLGRYLRAANRSESAIATYLIASQQVERFLGALETARRINLKAFMGDALGQLAVKSFVTGVSRDRRAV